MSSTWVDLEALGAYAGAVPDEYRWFVERYGPGVINGVLTVYAPVAGQPSVDLIACHEEFAHSLRRSRAAGVTDEKAFPETNGLLLWASASDGTSYYWRTTDGSPEAWDVVCGNGELDFSDISLSTAEVLVAVASRRRGYDHAPSPDAAAFEPWVWQDDDELPEEPVIMSVSVDSNEVGEVEIAPGASLQETQARVDAFIARLEQEFPDAAAAVIACEMSSDPVVVRFAAGQLTRAAGAVADWELET